MAHERVLAGARDVADGALPGGPGGQELQALRLACSGTGGRRLGGVLQQLQPSTLDVHRSYTTGKAGPSCSPQPQQTLLTLLAWLGGALSSKAAGRVASWLGGTQRILFVLRHTLGVPLCSGLGESDPAVAMRHVSVSDAAPHHPNTACCWRNSQLPHRLAAAAALPSRAREQAATRLPARMHSPIPPARCGGRSLQSSRCR